MVICANGLLTLCSHCLVFGYVFGKKVRLFQIFVQCFLRESVNWYNNGSMERGAKFLNKARRRTKIRNVCSFYFSLKIGLKIP